LLLWASITFSHQECHNYETGVIFRNSNSRERDHKKSIDGDEYLKQQSLQLRDEEQQISNTINTTTTTTISAAAAASSRAFKESQMERP
jgi:hypothetical protein